jgi:hypothetical protein
VKPDGLASVPGLIRWMSSVARSLIVVLSRAAHACADCHVVFQLRA